MTPCGGKRQLQPTNVAARVPARSVLMQIPHQELSAVRISCGGLILRWFSICCAKVLNAY
jgi:hypothetical protein